jgi:hypothetical protein
LLTVKPDIWKAIDIELSSLELDDTLIITEKNSEEILNSMGYANFSKKNYKSKLPLILPKKIIILVSDYKLYTKLSLEQNWDQGFENSKNVDKLSKILHEVQNNYDVDKTIVSFPTFYYEFKLNLKTNKLKPSSFWGHKLKDLTLPYKTEDKNVISSFVIGPNKNYVYPPQNEIYLNIINKKPSFIGELRCGDITISLEENTNIWNLFSSYFGEELPDDLTAFSWTHKPLASFSVRYEGSWSVHKASVTKIDTSSCNENPITISNNSDNQLRVWNLEN